MIEAEEDNMTGCFLYYNAKRRGSTLYIKNGISKAKHIYEYSKNVRWNSRL